MHADFQLLGFSGRTPKEMLGRLAFGCMVLSVLALGAVNAWIGVQLQGKTFAGFMVNQRLMVGDISRYGWTGALAGLKYPDRILKVEGTEVRTYAEFDALLRAIPPGLVVLYTVWKDGQAVDIGIRTMRFAWGDFFYTFGIYLLMGIAYLLIGSSVYVMKPDRPVSWALLIACYFLSLSVISGWGDCSVLWIVRLHILLQALLPASAVHFALMFPETKKLVQDRPWAIAIPYGVSLLIGLPVVTTYPRSDFIGLLGWIHVYIAASVLLLVGAILRAYLGRSTPIERQRAKVVLFGASLAFPIPAFAQLLTSMGSRYGSGMIPTNITDVPMILFPASIAYTIARHNLFDVDLYIKRAVGYSIMTVVVGLSYFGMQLVIRAMVSRSVFGDYAEFIYTIVFALLVVFLFNPARDGLQRVIDRFFYRLEYDYNEVLRRIGESMRSLFSLQEICNNMMHTALRTMFIDSGCVLVLNPGAMAYECVCSEGSREPVCSPGALAQGTPGRPRPDGGDRDGPGKGPPTESGDPGSASTGTTASPEPKPGNGGGAPPSLDARHPLMQRIQQTKSEISIYEVREDPRYARDRRECLDVFDRLESTLIIPLVYQDQVTGLIAVGGKKSGKFYKREDIDLLKSLADQGAVAIENARLVGEVIEKERMEEELAIARDLQMSMLPTACPEIEGFEISAVSVPAREVGGDFYDFVPMRTGKLGLVIGDVTGKSISGALVMAASRSIFRMLSEQELSLGEIMNRANRRTKQDIKSGMFVALLFAMIDARTMTLGLSSAGQTQPIHFRSDGGDAVLIETEGDSFPLGLLDDAEYVETKIALSEGDKVVFYTDGIVEAMNAEQELFGFDRLIRLVADRGTGTAPELLQGVLDAVRDFSGGAAQHDDLTLIVLASVPRGSR